MHTLLNYSFLLCILSSPLFLCGEDYASMPMAVDYLQKFGYLSKKNEANRAGHKQTFTNAIRFEQIIKQSVHLNNPANSNGTMG